VYLHEAHAVAEWRERMAGREKQEAVAACHDEKVAEVKYISLKICMYIYLYIYICIYNIYIFIYVCI
jgi:hypothetical protein